VDGGFVDANGYLGFECYGGGPAYIFTQGKVIPGFWLRDEEDSARNRYYSAPEKEVVLNQGKTWVCMIWGDYEDLITYE
jgi:hypothetical protein